MSSADYSADFYRHHAHQYAQVAQEWRQSVYIKSSHPALKNDWDAWERLRQLTPGNRGLDAGCGAGARDVRNFQLFDGAELLALLERKGMKLIHSDRPDELGGFLYFTDGKGVDHSLVFSRKQAATE